jgi:pimeloyl-ACP methyl ester carboxylesterase
VNPFFFGPSHQQQLFGVYEPATTARSQRGAVICYPWAREYLLAYPTLRLLTRTLAERGWHVLRFDYLGTGDSAGGAAEGSHRQWVTDIGIAVQELRDLAQVRQVALIGMRHGAALSAVAAAETRDVDRLVLWDPVADGRAYLRELGDTANGPESDVQGAVLTERLRADIASITPAIFAGGLPRTLVVSTGQGNAADPVAASLHASGTEHSVAHVPDIQVWREEWGQGSKGLAVAAVERIVSWLD